MAPPAPAAGALPAEAAAIGPLRPGAPRASTAPSAAGATPWLIAPVVALAAFMEVLDISIANVALQHIAGSLAAGAEESAWVLTSYLVANAIVLPLSGWLSSVIGRKRFFMGCIAGFSATSLLCGLAPNLTSLIVFRTLQGATGGGLQPSSQAILTDAFPPAQRGMALALYGIAVVFAPAIGPTLGGWITDNFSWRWVFLINVPVGAVLLLLTVQFVHDSAEMVTARLRKLRAGIRIDYLGFGLLALGLGCLQVVLDKGQQDNWFDTAYIGYLSATAAAAVAAFVLWELRRADPIVDLHLLRDRNFAIANLLMFMLGFILMGSTVLLPLFVQTLLGYTAMDAGLVISPGGFLIMLVMPIVGALVSRLDVRWLIVFGLMVCSGALLHMSHFDLGVDYTTIAATRAVQAVGLAFLFIPINTAAYAHVSPAKSGNASALINLARNLGGSVGIAMAVTLLQRRAQVHQSHLVSHLTPYDPAYNDFLGGLSRRFAEEGGGAAHALHQAQGVLQQVVHEQANMLAYIDDFRFLAAIFVALIPLVFLMQRGAARGGAH